MAGRARCPARVRARRRGGPQGRGRDLPAHHAHRPSGHPRRSRRRLAQDLRMAGRRRGRPDAVLARRVAAGRRGGRGADGAAGDRARAVPRADPRVPRGHGDPGARDGRSSAEVHVGRSPRREAHLARQAGRRPGPRAEQPRLGGGAQRQGAHRGPGRRRGGGTAAGRRAPVRRAALGRRCRARAVPSLGCPAGVFGGRSRRPRRRLRRLARGPRRQRTLCRPARGDRPHAGRTRHAGGDRRPRRARRGAAVDRRRVPGTHAGVPHRDVGVAHLRLSWAP